MRRQILIATLAAIALAVSGCGATKHPTTAKTWSFPRTRIYVPPRWVNTTIAREAKLFHGWPPSSGSVHSARGSVFVDLGGTFASPTGRSCMPGCPAPAHGNVLDFLISLHTHRIEHVTLTRWVDPFAAARRSNGYLRKFPKRPGQTRCQIPSGGPAPGRLLAGRCMTEYASATRESAAAHAVRIQFGERWGPGPARHAAWVFTVRYRDGKILDTHIEGDPPQLWR